MIAKFLRTRGRSVAALASTLVLAFAAQVGVTATEASWNESEWVHDRIGTLDCSAPAGQFQTRGEGQFLSGSLLGVDLDNVAEVKGVEVTHDGTDARVDPVDAVGVEPAGNGGYANPLTVETLETLELQFGEILQLPLNNDLGVVGQYGQASDSGLAAGASGLITESGGIALDNGSPTYPHLATLQLSDLISGIDPVVGGALTELADVSLEIGAVAGRANFDGCDYAWGGDLASTLDREYLASSLDVVLNAPTVGSLVVGVEGIVEDLERAVENIAGSSGTLESIAGGLTGLLNTLLGADNSLSLGQIAVDSLRVDIDLGDVRALLAETRTDSDGVLTLDLSSGKIQIDTAALLASAYPDDYSNGLNGLAPNTNILNDPLVVNTLTTALGSVLDDWTRDVTSAIFSAVDSVEISVDASVDLMVTYTLLIIPVTVEVGEIHIGVDGTLEDFRNGDASVAASAKLLGGLLGPVQDILDLLLDPLLSGIVAGAGSAVGAIVSPLLDGLILESELASNLLALTQPVVDAVSGVYRGLFLDGVVSITVNAQNEPVVGHPEPADWATALEEGRYDVAALRIGVLDGVGDAGVRLYLGRGSVGPGCLVTLADPACAGY
ncbi:MAG: choice-of-anchor G family protein [Gulosibacter sp.]|uniref:choice-of-anchor G family protein n=1 Tax=Gulosibacter sp. TaxID=2817531 RepID=UPI003F90073B